MPAPSHGFFQDGVAGCELRFGTAALFSGIWVNSLPFSKRKSGPWPFRPVDRRFSHLNDALRDVIWKLEHAATRYAEVGAEYSARIDDDSYDFWRHQKSLSLYMDSIIVYLRVLPDVVAALTTYLYPPQTGDIGSRSFRTQSKWLLGHPEFDPDYSRLLRGELGWFELLAGKNGRGIRDTLIHRFGRFQHAVVTGPHALRGRVGSDMISESEYLDDVQRALTSIATQLCSFLDSYVDHQSSRILAAAGWTPLASTDLRAGYMMTFDAPPPSAWLLPMRVVPRAE